MELTFQLVLLASTISCCLAIQCYECTLTELGAGDPKCDDQIYDLDPPFSKECDPNVYEKCRKVKTYLANGKTSVVRACAERTCYDKGCKKFEGQVVCDHCCFGDLCNSANSTTFDTAMIVALLLSVRWTFYLWLK
ncbi:uncharacterized protein [Asterias amurensis]|uniref:uncharacterized protein n=1 Tax=Asterias amurensis TaxID=7602 RepID=UPI003AB540FA